MFNPTDLNCDILSLSVRDSVTTAVLEAGQRIMDIYSTDFEVETKVDSSPLTAADLASNAVLTAALQPYYPVLSEESASVPYNRRKGWSRFWLIDPLDGTKEFVKRNGEFTVNVALIEDGVPVAGWVYAPVPDLLYWGISGQGAWTVSEASKGGESTSLPHSRRSDSIRIVASRSHMNEETKAYIAGVEEEAGSVELIMAGSSLKLCMVAEGKADIYPRFGPTMEWDTAAADAVCRAAGAQVTRTGDTRPLEYNKEDLYNPYFIVKGKNV